MTLEAEFVTLLTSVADSGRPLGRVADWFDAHEGAFRGELASAELRIAVQEALAICWSVRHRLLTDAAARAQLRRLADLLAAARSGESRADLVRADDSALRWVGRRRRLGP
ncbi:MAG TPA: hypothetical protein VGL23_23260 [Chloroflexota bacterium]|jgi:hypothetical protein